MDSLYTGVSMLQSAMFELEFSEQAAMGRDEMFTFIRAVF